MMNADVLEVLRKVDTPTVCNAIEIVDGHRAFDRFTRGTVVHTEPTGGAIVGYALTAKIAAADPPGDPSAATALRKDYYRYMAADTRPTIAVLEDVDETPGIGAFWGEINTTVHKAFGVSGVLTNGSVRDLDVLPQGFPVIAGSLSPSHAFVHLREIGGPVTVFGLNVAPGDLIHADRHGALVIPAEVIDEMSGAIERLIAAEAKILGPASEPGFDIDRFEAAWAEFQDALSNGAS